MNRIAELNERFFELFGRLQENAEYLDEATYKKMQENLREQYNKEYKMIKLEKDVDDETVLFKLEEIKRLETPKVKFLFFKNEAAQLALREVEKRVQYQFEHRKRRLKAEEAESEEVGEDEQERAETGEQDGEEAEQEGFNAFIEQVAQKVLEKVQAQLLQNQGQTAELPEVDDDDEEAIMLFDEDEESETSADELAGEEYWSNADEGSEA